MKRNSAFQLGEAIRLEYDDVKVTLVFALKRRRAIQSGVAYYELHVAYPTGDPVVINDVATDTKMSFIEHYYPLFVAPLFP